MEVAQVPFFRSPEDQVFSNHVTAHEIWSYFNVKDLLKISLVNKDWSEISRKFLEKKICCVQLSSNPCAALKNFDDFLGANPNAPSIYNGIRHERKLFASVPWPSKYYEPIACNNDCLSLQPNINSDVKELYSNVLRKMKFNFVGFRAEGNEYCPFMRFIRYVLKHRSDEIRELHFTGLLFERGSINLRSYWGISRSRTWFPYLTVLKIPKHDMDLSLELIASAPNLEKIIGSFYNSTYREWRDPDGYFPVEKRFARTVAKAIGVSDILYLADQVQPKCLEKLTLAATPKRNEDNSYLQSSVLRLSSVISHSLKFLSCSFSTLGLVANVEGISSFRALETMELFNDLGNASFKKGLEYLKSVNFQRVFPTLVEVKIHDGICVSIPFLYDPAQNFQSLSVKALQISRCGWESIPIAANIFVNVTRLQMHSIDKGLVANLIRDNSVWPNLEELHFWNCLEDLQLDRYFYCSCCNSQDLPALPHVVPDNERQASFFNRQNMTKLSILGSSACFLAKTVLKGIKNYLVSKETARSICRHSPGFTIELKVEMSESIRSISSGGNSNDFNFEHLTDLADISYATSEVKQGLLTKNSLRVWSIRFRSLDLL